ncbi:MAG: hypothetical protein M0Z77_02615 [Thermoplasmatales archaeon]|nr:hypothetical protein [Thermoplasmatales archaeon]
MEPRFKAVRKFTDREEPTNIFLSCLEDLTVRAKEKKILVFYGIGGVGKTKLLSHLREIAKRKAEEMKNRGETAGLRNVSISLDVYEFDTPLSILIALRNQLRIPCLLFDYALLKYWALVGHSPLEVKNWLEKDSIVRTVVEGSLGAVHIPLSTVEKVYEMLRTRFSKRYQVYKEHFDRVKSLGDDATELFNLLPRLLGIDIYAESRESNIRFVFFIDSYESIKVKFDYSGSRVSADQFIRDLISSAGYSLFVIAGREFLKWEDFSTEWKGLLGQHIMTALTPEDADYFLRSVPIENDEIRSAIIATSGGLPLYLDLCVSIYEHRMTDGLALTVDDFRIPGREVVERFMSHLSESERELIKLLSAIHFFEYDLFSFVIKEFNVGYALTRFDEFIEHSFVGEPTGEDGIYKIHDAFRTYVIDTFGTERWVEKLSKGVISYLSGNRDRLSFAILTLYLSSALSLLESAGSISVRETENLLDVSIFLIDNGYWKNLGIVIDQTRIRYNRALNAPIYLIYAACVGRGGKLMDALEAIAKVQGAETTLGKYETYRAYYEADILRIIGRIPESRLKFEELGQKLKSSQDPDLYIKVMREIADLTYIHSEFNSALSILEKIAQMGARESRQYAETIRIKGHIYRANLQLQTAEDIYREALDISEKVEAVGLRGELLNNLTEVNCWFNPDKALKYGNESLTHNTDIGFKVEIGKTHAAMAIACAVKGLYEDAEEHLKESLAVQEETGYLGGIMWAKLAEFVIAAATGDTERLELAAASVKDANKTMESDVFVELLISVCLEQDVHDLENRIDWFNFDETRKLYEKFCGSLKHNTRNPLLNPS